MNQVSTVVENGQVVSNSVGGVQGVSPFVVREMRFDQIQEFMRQTAGVGSVNDLAEHIGFGNPAAQKWLNRYCDMLGITRKELPIHDHTKDWREIDVRESKKKEERKKMAKPKVMKKGEKYNILINMPNNVIVEVTEVRVEDIGTVLESIGRVGK